MVKKKHERARRAARERSIGPVPVAIANLCGPPGCSADVGVTATNIVNRQFRDFWEGGSLPHRVEENAKRDDVFDIFAGLSPRFHQVARADSLRFEKSHDPTQQHSCDQLVE